MKYKKYIILIFLFAVILLCWYFVFGKSNKIIETNNVITSQNTAKEVANITTQKQIGDMWINFPPDSIISVDKLTYLNLSLNIRSIFTNQDTLQKNVREKTFLTFYYLKNENIKNESIEKWFEAHNPEEEKQSPFAVINSEKIKVNNIDSLKVIFYAADYISGGYYNLQSVYIPYKTDIYEIQSYVLPKEPDPALTPEDIKNAQEYERVAEQITRSIHFVQ